jgi:hypothetical protein
VGEFAGNPVSDGDQVPDGAVAAGLGLGGLDQRVGALDAAVGELGVEGIEDAGPVVLEGLGDLLDGVESATTGPGIPLVQERLGLLAAGGAVEDLPQALLDAEGTVSLEVELFEIGELGDLGAGPGALVLQPEVAAALEAGGGLRLLAADLVDGLVDQLDDVELVEGDRRPGQVLGDAGAVAGGHIDADVLDVLGAAAVGFEVVGELRHDLGLAALAGEQQTPGVEVVKQADGVVPAPCGRLVQADGGHRGEVLLGAGPRDVVIQGAPQAHVPDAEQLRHLADGHRLAQGHDQGLHQRGEAAVGTGPGHRDLGRLGAGRAAHPRHLGVEVSLELEEVQMAPLALLGVMHRLMLGPAVGTGEARPRREGHLEVDAPSRAVEGHIGHAPRRLQAQRDGEQRGRIHGDTPSLSACGLVDESCGPARALRAVWTTHGPRRPPPTRSASPEPARPTGCPPSRASRPPGPQAQQQV